jgi:Gpi18-like mannosyltransferase
MQGYQPKKWLATLTKSRGILLQIHAVSPYVKKKQRRIAALFVMAKPSV